MPGGLPKLMSELVASGAVSAASAIIGDGRRILAEARGGWVDGARLRRLESKHRFDLASLTKPWTATLALALDERGIVPLGLAIGEVWPAAPATLARRTLSDLLRHRSGLLAWRPLYRHLRDPGRVVTRLLDEDCQGAPRPTYSDLGYILWARSAEALTGQSLEALLRRWVLRPLRLSTVETAPAPAGSVKSALDNEREIELAAALGVAVRRRTGPGRGVVQDGNARFLGGMAGHAGLFAPARALWRLGAEWLEPTRLLTATARDAALAGRGRYSLGWWRASAAPRAARPLTAGSFGHHGFTGGSLWVDRGRRRVAVLLAHRVATGVDLDPWRERLHQLAVEH